ncbi:MAG TPA: N-acetylglucosamine kinase, partial [Pantoea sp.]|nr:N-acetylglucosamine kinase [Pantoea sp.]
MSSPYYLGIDGGGTRCRARLIDAQGKVLAQAEGGPANVF